MTLITKAFTSQDEHNRQCALDRLNALDTEVEPEFDNITRLVTTCLDVPIAGVSLVDKNRLWYKSIRGSDVRETKRDIAFCDHTIRSARCLNISDTRTDPRFENNPFVVEVPHIRSYLGAPLCTRDGYGIGALCAMDFKPRTFSIEQERVLEGFARLVMTEFELRAIAQEDELTGLASRRAFMDFVDIIVLRAQTATLITLDLDRFKSVNDTFGHPAGDEVLRQVGQTLIKHCPDGSLAGRLGGEEFALLLVQSTEAEGLALAETIRTTVERLTFAGLDHVTITASFGVVEKSGPIERDAWMAAGDKALYRAKNQGRNRVCVASPLSQ